MPKQHVIFGRPVPRFGSRRLSFLLVCISLFAVFSLFFTLPSAIPAGPSLSEYADRKVSIPKIKNPFSKSILNPFRQPAHRPPRQKNDTYEESSWWTDYKWLSVPFSSSLTLDEDRSLLPPLKDRPPIYCYYDRTIQKDEASKDAESDLLLTWRRAWWAQGFKPVILSAAEAMNNPMYDELQRLEIDPDLKTDLMRWLAWENMSGGLLAQYTLLPMAARQDPLLVYLRRGEHPGLTRWNELDNGLFAGSKADITSAIKATLGGSQLKTAKDFHKAAPAESFKIDNYPKSVAFYDATSIEKKYGKVAEALKASRATGLKSLNQLIISHLHSTWQNVFKDGIAVLKPLPRHSTHMITNAFGLAKALAQCAETPMPSSCPPNNPKCSPCVSTSPMRVFTPNQYHNSSTLYTIGTVPHPYTTALLTNLRDDIDVPWIRRKSERDIWLAAVTKEILGTGRSGAPRVMKFKEAMAGDFATAHSLWLTAEKDIPEDLTWHFGFTIPTNATDGKSKTPIPGRKEIEEADPENGPVSSEDDLEKEPVLLKKAIAVGKSTTPTDITLRNAIEAWNLADTEAWKFARAFLARRIVERKEWEKDEARYTKGAGSEKGRKSNGWGRWGD
jgi:hypothetical protein